MAKQKKLPSMQFYTGDWMTDTNLRGVSLSSKGLWIDMLCLMHESDRRGYLQSNGKPISHDQLARMTGCSSDEVSQCLEELENSGVFSRTKNGIIYSRRMSRDEDERQKSIENGKLGGNPFLKRDKGGVNPLVIPKQTPSVSVSSSINHTHKRARDPDFSTSSIDGFESVFSPSYEHCLSVWKEVSGKGVDQATREGAKTLAQAIDGGDLRREDLAGIIRNGLQDVSDGKLPNQTLRGIARNWTRYVPETEMPKKRAERRLYATWSNSCGKCGASYSVELLDGNAPPHGGDPCPLSSRNGCDGVTGEAEKIPGSEIWK